MGRRSSQEKQAAQVVDSTDAVAAVFAADAEQPETADVVLDAAPAAAEDALVAQLSSFQQRWRVTRAKRVSLFGCLTTLREGDIISAATYGEQAFSRLLEQGVELVPF
jgi:hypothetical protein